MQIKLATARGVGYTGDAEGLLDPDTLTALTEVQEPAVAVTAVWFGDVRLIDNLLFTP